MVVLFFFVVFYLFVFLITNNCVHDFDTVSNFFEIFIFLETKKYDLYHFQNHGLKFKY